MTLWVALALLAGLTGYLVIGGLDRRRQPVRESALGAWRRRFASGEIGFEDYRRRVVEHANAIYGPHAGPPAPGRRDDRRGV